MEVDTTATKQDEKLGFPVSQDLRKGLPLKMPARKLGLVIGLLILLIVGAVAVFMLLKKPPATTAKSKIPVLTVTAEQAALRPMPRTIKVNGTIWPWDPLAIGSQVSGLSIQEILVDEGHVVRQGQILARLDSSVLQAQLEQEKARLQVNHAALSKAIQPNRVEDIYALRDAVAQADASVAQEKSGIKRAQANLNNALENSRRYSDLVRQGAVSAQDAGNRDTDAKLAEADVRSAEQRVRAAQFAHSQATQRYNMAKEGGRREDVQISRANVSASQATVRQLEAQVAQTIIRSPVNGLIMKRDAHLGDISSTSKSLFSIVRDNRLELRAQVAEKELALLRPGLQVDITGSATDKSIKAVIREISPLIDQETRLGTVRIDVPSSAGFKPGNFVRGDIELGKSQVLTIPSQAVLTKNDQSFALVLNAENQAQSHIVKTGNRSANMVEILAGLTPADTVIVKGAGFVKDGDYVRVGVAE
ncbi:efflux RND transporter periplasmic adaptor subunit [soil metagenome]